MSELEQLWKLLNQYCYDEGIEVVLRTEPSSQRHILASSQPVAPWKIHIYRHESLSLEEKVFALAHEIGHTLDAKDNGYDFLYEIGKMNLANNEELSKQEQDCVLSHERLADTIALNLLDTFGYTQLGAYRVEVEENIKAYERLFELRRNLSPRALGVTA